MALTTYGVTTSRLTGNHYQSLGFQGSAYTITAHSYTNPNSTFTTSTNHNFQVNHRVTITGINQAGTSAPLNSTGYVITAVTANTFTINIGATTPSTYSGGGVVYLDISGNPQGAKYINGTYILWLANYGAYFYSSDAINWNQGNLPISSSRITCVEWDGNTYLFGTEANGIYTSTTLLPNSWTQRTTFGGFTVNEIKWCAGSVSRLVAVGSNVANDPQGTGGRIETALQGGGSWTNQTITGTFGANSFKSIAFDGNSTIIAQTDASGIAISTSGAGSWTGYAAASTQQPDGNANNGLKNSSANILFWNTQASKWVGFRKQAAGITGGVSTAGSPSSTWTKEVTNYAYSNVWYSTSDRTYGVPNTSNAVTYDQQNGKFYTYTSSMGNFVVYTYNATPVSLNAHQEYYPLISIASADNAITTQTFSAATTLSTFPSSVFCYGNGKWVGLSSGSQQGNTQNYTFSVYQ